MCKSAAKERLQRSVRNSLMIVPLALLISVGIGVTVTDGLIDLGVEHTFILAVQILILIMSFSLCLFLLNRYTQAQADQEKVKQSSLRRWFVRLLFGATILVLISGTIILMDGKSLEAWRFAVRLVPGELIEKRIAGSPDWHHVNLDLSHVTSLSDPIAKVKLPFRITIFGGKIELATRLVGAKPTPNQGDCRGSGSTQEEEALRLAPGSPVIVVGSSCANWSNSEWRLPRAQDDIPIYLSSEITDVESVQIQMLGASTTYPIAHIGIVLVSFSLFFSLVLLAAFQQDDKIFENEVDIVSRYKAWNRKCLVWSVLVASTFLSLANVAVYTFSAQERTIYTWDFGGHWMSVVSVVESMTREHGQSGGVEVSRTVVENQTRSTTLAASSGDMPSLLQSLLRNIRYTDYNPTIAIPIAISLYPYEPTRTAFVLSLVNTYVLAAGVMLGAFLWVTARRKSIFLQPYWPVIPAVIILFFNPFWVPVVRGYLGVGVVFINLLVLLIYFRKPKQSLGVRSIIVIGILIAVSVIMRRWNAYWVVGFFVVIFIDALYQFLRQRNYSATVAVGYFRPTFLIGFVATCVLSVIAWPLVVTMLTTDYADIYSAYADVDFGFLGHLDKLVRDFGLFLLGSCLFALLLGVTSGATRKVTLLFALQSVVIYVLFSRTQTMGPHHLYLLMPSALVILGLGFVVGIHSKSIKTKQTAIVAFVVYAASGVLSHMAVFVPSGDTVAEILIPWVPDNRRLPLTRNDIDEFDRLARYLDDKVRSAGPDADIYVLSSSTVFSSAHLRMLEVSTKSPFESQDRLLRSAAIDKRDGFPSAIFEAEYVLVGKPIQLHRAEETQQVVRIPAEQMLSGAGIGRAFKRLPESFALENDVTVLVYERVRDNTSMEIMELSERLREAYPERPDIFLYR